jgi:hypothetical protein
VYGEPVDVWVRDGRPVRFVWRGRLYTVLGVLDRWAATRQWWHEPAPRPATREFWRVTAVPGQGAPAAYELRHDAATDGWLLTRVWD